MNDKKSMMEWEEVPVKELFSHDEEYSDEKPQSPFEVIINRYFEKDVILRILHTNFNLTFRILKAVSNTEGIETIVPIGRYRVAVSFGKLFNMDEAKKSVKVNINNLLYPKKLRQISKKKAPPV